MVELDITDQLSSEETSSIKALFESNPFLGCLQEEASKSGIRVALAGGAIRDLLLGAGAPRDFDVFIEAGAGELLKAAQARYKEKYSDRKNPGRIDVAECPSIVERIAVFDFTLNALFWDFNTNRLIDVTGRGLKDLRERTLWPTSVRLLLTFPRAQLRLFKLSARLDLRIPEEVTKLLEQYRGTVLLGSPFDNCLLLCEFLEILSLPDVSETVSKMERVGILERFVPEFSFLGGGEEVSKAVERVKDTFSKLETSTKEELSRLREILIDFPGGDTRLNAHIQVNDLAIARLLAGLRASYSALFSIPNLSKGPEGVLPSESSAEKNLLANFLRRYSMSHTLVRTLSNKFESLDIRALSDSALLSEQS